MPTIMLVRDSALGAGGPLTHGGPRRVVGRISGWGKVGIAGSARPECTSAGRFQDSASCGRTVPELGAVLLGLAHEVQGVVDLFPVEPLVLERAERTLADAVLAGRLDPGAYVPQLRPGGDEPTEPEGPQAARRCR